MFCGNCGTKNPDVNKFCRECGTKLAERQNRTLTEDQFADLRAPVPSPPVDHGKVAVLMDVAFSYHREGKLDQAIETCLQATSLNQRSTSAHSLLALLYEERGQFDLAMTHLQRVLDLNPESVADQERLSRLLGDAPAVAQGAGARKPSAKFAWAANRPLLISVACSVVVLVGILAAAGPLLKDSSKTGEGEQPTPPAQPPAYQSIEAAVRDRRMGEPGLPPEASAAQPVLAEDAATPPTPPPLPRDTATPPSSATPAPARRPPTLPGEEEIEPLPLPEPRRAAVAPPVIYLPPRQRQRPVASARGTPTPREPEPVDVAVTVEQSAASPPMRANLAPERGSPAPSPGSRATVKVHETTPGDYQEWGLSASAKGEYESALASFRKALDGTRSSRDRGKIHQHMAYAYQQLGRNSDAETEYRRAISEYQDQIKEGSSGDLARSSIRSCEDGLRMLGM